MILSEQHLLFTIHHGHLAVIYNHVGPLSPSIMEGSGRQVYNLYEQLRSQGAVRLELRCGLDGREYFTFSNHPPGPPPPSPVIKRRRRRHRTRRRSIPTPSELPSKTSNGRAAPTLPTNGRDVKGLPANIRDVSGPLKDGRVVRNISRKW